MAKRPKRPRDPMQLAKTGGAFIYVVILALLAVILVTPAHAQVHVDIGIHLPAPPQLVIVPEVRTVQYVPSAPANLFFYSNQYWAFANGGWYVSAGYNGPWIVVAPQFVPRPVLLVPVNYYRVPPVHWKQWQKQRPPRWGNEWGREWAVKRAWNDDGDSGGSKGHGKGDKRKGDKGDGKGQGHGKDEGRGDGKGQGHGKDEGRGDGKGGKGQGHGKDEGRGDGKGGKGQGHGK